MINKKGQGALEYLLILAAVLAIAVVVILVAHQIATPAQNSALINQDKYNCAQAGIDLVNYNALPNSGADVHVMYKGHEADCDSFISNAEATCTVHRKGGTTETIGVSLSGDSLECGVTTA